MVLFYPLATREGPADDVLTPYVLEAKRIAPEIHLDFVRIQNTKSNFPLS